MSRFRKREARTVPSLNTASLPDLIFTLLFFFMLVTSMRTVPTMTQFTLPKATEMQKLKEKSLLVYIMVGQEDKSNPDVQPKIQLDSGFVTLDEMPEKLMEITEKKDPDELAKMVVILKIDKNTQMGLINDIRKILREARLLTVYYSAEKSF
jgi:biopolymer transport protein ExbD